MPETSSVVSTPKWPADKVERWPIRRLIPYARNARLHSEAQISQLAASITEWGWTMPALVDEKGVLIAGHGRILAARQLGITEIPTMVADGWSEAKKRAYRIADNKLTENSTWSDELLRLEIGDLNSEEFDLSLLGFSDESLADLLAERTEGLTDPDDVPEVPEHPVSRPGDLWILGRHRLLCGDATVESDVKRVLNGVVPHLMVTDPPYGVDYDPKWRDQSLGTWSQPISVGTINNDHRIDWREAWGLFPGDVVYCWHADRHASKVQLGLESGGFEIRCQIIWAKSHFPISRGDYHWQHEPCWYAVRKAKVSHWSGDRAQSTLWQIANLSAFRGGSRTAENIKSGHGAQKPVECMRRPIENNSSLGQAVYDPFLGSGTTVIAAEQIGRSCLALEISPAYVDVSVFRWQDFTGAVATLEGDGRTFAEVAAGRAADRKAA